MVIHFVIGTQQRQRIRNLKGVKEDRTSKERLFTGIKLIAG
jgi:hypothetical protein